MQTLLDKVSELTYDSEIKIISNLCITKYAVKSITCKKLWDAILFKLQWRTEKPLKEGGLWPAFSSISLLSLIT